MSIPPTFGLCYGCGCYAVLRQGLCRDCTEAREDDVAAARPSTGAGCDPIAEIAITAGYCGDWLASWFDSGRTPPPGT